MQEIAPNRPQFWGAKGSFRGSTAFHRALLGTKMLFRGPPPSGNRLRRPMKAPRVRPARARRMGAPGEGSISPKEKSDDERREQDEGARMHALLRVEEPRGQQRLRDELRLQAMPTVVEVHAVDEVLELLPPAGLGAGLVMLGCLLSWRTRERIAIVLGVPSLYELFEALSHQYKSSYYDLSKTTGQLGLPLGLNGVQVNGGVY